MFGKKKEEKINSSDRASGTKGKIKKAGGIVIGNKRIRIVLRDKAPTKKQIKELKAKGEDALTKGRRSAQVFWRIVALFVGACALIGVCGLGVILTWMMQAPEVDTSKLDFVGATVIYDINDEYYQELETSQRREVVSIREIPELVQLAFVSIEDQRFYSHFGVDLRGTMKAVVGVLTSGGTEGSGGSTITQQLIKQTHLSSETSIRRKVMEWKLSYELEQELPKRKILEAYLNKINLSAAWGVESASETIFGIKCDELSVAQSAVLASIMKAPTLYGPYNYVEDSEGKIYLEKTVDENGNVVPVHKAENKERALLIVDKMLELGHISEKEHDIAVNELKNDLIGLKIPDYSYEYTYFTDAVYNEVLEDLVEKYNYKEADAIDLLTNGGLQIYSTVDPVVQNALEDAAADDSNFPGQTYQAMWASEAVSAQTGENIEYITQVGGAVIQNHTGYVVGIIGGREKTGNLVINRALQKFQTGSSTKPITTYAPGIDSKKVTLADTFDDSLIAWGSWVPHDSGGSGSGIMSVRQALTASINIVAVQVQKTVGYDICADYAKKFGLDILPDDYNSAALALGGYTEGQTPLAMASAFSTFANYGKRVTPTFYRYVTDSNGVIILDSPQETVDVISEQSAWIITSVLKNVVKGGTTYITVDGQELAGKTGTTDDKMCAWFCGYSADYSAAFWFGYDVQRVTVNGYTYNLNVGVYGGDWNGPANFFEEVFRQFYAAKGLPASDLPSMPDGVVWNGDWALPGTYPTGVSIPSVKVTVCAESQLLPNDTCPAIEMEFKDRSQAKIVEGGKYYGVAKDSVPTETCPIHHETEPEEPDDPDVPVDPVDPTDPEKPTDPESGKTGN